MLVLIFIHLNMDNHCKRLVTVFSVMFGDRLDTDIQFGINCGLTTVLTLTGITSETDAQKSSIKPDHIIPDFTKIL